MIRIPVVLITALAALLGASLVEVAANSLALEVRDHAVTLRAREVPLDEILRRFAAATGITFTLQEAAPERLSLDVAAVGVEDVLRRLLAHRSTLFVYEGPDMPATVFVFGLRPGRDRLLTGGEGADAADMVVPDELEALGPDLAAGIDTIEAQLHDTSGAASPEGARLLQQLFAAPELSAQITALQWLAGDQDALIDAVASALKGGDHLVQEVAREILLERGADEIRLGEILEAASVEDVSTVRRMVNALLVSP